MKATPNQIQQFLNSFPNKFKVLEKGISIQIQKEYVEYSGTFAQGELGEKETLFLSNILFRKDMPIEGKKKALVLLAHLGTIFAFRQIEKYLEEPEEALKEWALMALHECKMFLENELLDENVGLIMTGLGGTANMLRFYFLLLPLDNQTFNEIQKSIISWELPLVCKDLNCVLEKKETTDFYTALTVLVPHDVAIATLLDTAIEKCNKSGEFVLEHYYATNMNILNQSEIKGIIKIVREG